MVDQDSRPSAEPRTLESMRRAHLPLPPSIRDMMHTQGVWDAWESRPAYHRDAYISWITDADHPSATAQRVDTMVSELRSGDAFMGEPWNE